jgi:hypothetical protein
VWARAPPAGGSASGFAPSIGAAGRTAPAIKCIGYRQRSPGKTRPIIDVSIAVHHDGRVALEGYELKLAMWNHGPETDCVSRQRHRRHVNRSSRIIRRCSCTCSCVCMAVIPLALIRMEAAGGSNRANGLRAWRIVSNCLNRGGSKPYEASRTHTAVSHSHR